MESILDEALKIRSGERNADYGNARVSGDAEVKKARDICWFSVFGSGNRTTTAYRTKSGIEIKCGCFKGSLSAFMEKIKQTHGDNDYAAEYLAICEVIKARFGIKNNE